MEQITSAQLTPSAALANAAVSKEASNSDFDTFIRMLTAQMQNQDPLNPIESADFATQLATFSAVEQQVQTDDLLAGIGAQMGAFNLAQMAGWVGMEGRAVMPVSFDGSPVSLRLEGAATAQTHQLVVRDVSGSVVSREDITGAAQNLEWQGKDAFGAPLTAGTYQISVESFSRGEFVSTTPSEVRGQIIEARPENGQVLLVFRGGQEVPSDKILSLKRP